jgi:hypothetical protein
MAKSTKNTYKPLKKGSYKTALKMEDGGNVSELNYSERKDYIEQNYAPFIQDAQMIFTIFDNSFEYDYKKDRKEVVKEIIEYYESLGDYTEETLLKETVYEIKDFEIVRRELDLDTDEYYDETELEEITSDNTYNFSYLGLVDLNWRLYYDAENEKYFYVIMPHLGGDIRGNYGNAIILQGSDKDDLFYRFYEGFISGGASIYLKFLDGSEIGFDSEQDSDVFNFRLNEVFEPTGMAQKYLNDFEKFDSYKGDEFLEETIDLFLMRNGNAPKMMAGGSLDDETPKAYIEILGNNNEGKWIDLTDYSDGNDVIDGISEWMNELNEIDGGNREEYRVADFEGFGNDMFDEYMGMNDFDEIIEAYQKYTENEFPTDVIFEYKDNIGNSTKTISDIIDDMENNYFGRYDDYESFGLQMVDEGIYSPSVDDVYITDTDKRILAGEEADAYVNDLSFEEALKIADDVREKYDDEVSELEEKISNIESEIEDLTELRKTADDDDEYEIISEQIEEKEIEIDDVQTELDDIDSRYEDEAFEEVRDIQYELIYDKLENDLEDWLNEYGYNDEDLSKINFLSVDYDRIGEELSANYLVIEYNNELYFFSNYEKGGRLKASKRKSQFNYYVVENSTKKLVSGYKTREEAVEQRALLVKEYPTMRFEIFTLGNLEAKTNLDVNSKKDYVELTALDKIKQVSVDAYRYGQEKVGQANSFLQKHDVKGKIKRGARNVADKTKQGANWLKRQWQEADFGDGKGKAKFFDDGGSVESKVNELYAKSNFINDYYNWKNKLLEMFQDRSVEAYNIYESLNKKQKEEVLQELYSMDNDMGSYGDGDIESSKENLMILLDDAKNGKKYADGGGVNIGYSVFNYTDNIYATDEVFKTKGLANKFIKEFRNRFSNQGYYRDNRMNKINIQDIDLLAIPSDFNPLNKYADGGELTFFDRHASMDSETRDELNEMTNYPFLKEYFEGEDGEKKYNSIKSSLEREGVSVNLINNYLSGLFDGYNYSDTEGFNKEMAKLKIADKEFYNRIINLYEKISKYPKVNREYANGGMAGLGEVSGMLPSALPMSTIVPMAKGGLTKNKKGDIGKSGTQYGYTLKEWEQNAKKMGLLVSPTQYWKSQEGKKYKDSFGRTKTIGQHSRDEEQELMSYGYRIAIGIDLGSDKIPLSARKYVKDNNLTKFGKGGDLKDFSDNQLMIMNQNVELEHHHEELEDILKDETPVPAWAVSKIATATQSISDVTHYLDGQSKMANGGEVVRFYTKLNERLGRPSGSIEKEILDKVRDRFEPNQFVGGIGWKTPQGKLADGYLYKLDDFDRKLVSNIRLKETEKIFRYFNRTTAIGGMTPLIKINLQNGILYFAIYSDNDDVQFETKGVKALWVSIIEDNIEYAKGGEIQVGNKFGDWSITQYKPIVYEEKGGTRDGLIKLVNQDTFDEILVQYDGALRNPKWFARSKGVTVEGKSPKEVIEKLKIADVDEYAKGGLTKNKKGSASNRSKSVIHTINGKDRRFPIKDAWRKEHNIENKSEDYEVPQEDRFAMGGDASEHYHELEYGEGGIARAKEIITNKIGLNEVNADFITAQSEKFAIWLADSIVKLSTNSNLYGTKDKTIKTLNESPYLITQLRQRIRGILDWLENPNTPKQNLRELSFAQAEAKAKQWHDELTVSGGDINYAEPKENKILKTYPINEFGKTYYWVMLPSNTCDLESNRMGHCGQSSYSDNLISFRSNYTNVNGEEINDSHITIGYGDGLFYQVKGKQNIKPLEKYHPYIFDFIKSLVKGEIQYSKGGMKFDKNNKLNTVNIVLDFKGFSSEYASKEDYGWEDMTKQELTELYELNPNLFSDFTGKYMLYEAGLSVERPNTTIIIEKSPESVADLLKLDRDLSDDVVEKVLTGDTFDWFNGGDSWNYYYENANDYVDDLNKVNYEQVIDKIVELTGLDKADVIENGAKHYLAGDDEEFDSDTFDDINRAIASAMRDAEENAYVKYYYEQIESSLSELGTIKKLNDDGVEIEIDLSNLMSISAISSYLKDLETEYLEDVFFEAENQGDIELPDLSIDDRYSPSIEDEDFNANFDIDNYAKGGVIEVVGKGNKGAFRIKDYEWMSENEVIQWWEERGYKLSKTKSESSLKPYTFYINNKFAVGGSVDEEVSYINRRISNLEGMLPTLNANERQGMISSIDNLKTEREGLLNRKSGISQKKSFWSFGKGGSTKLPKDNSRVHFTDDEGEEFDGIFIAEGNGNPSMFLVGFNEDSSDFRFVMNVTDWHYLDGTDDDDAHAKHEASETAKEEREEHQYDVYDNKRMLKNQAREVEHHSEELNNQIPLTEKVPAWLIAKMERATTDLSDVTHYLDGENNYADGGELGDVNYDVEPYKDKFIVVQTQQNEDSTYPSKEIRGFKGEFLEFDDIKSAENFISKIETKYPYGIQKANFGAILMASELLQKKQPQQPQVVYYVPQQQEQQYSDRNSIIQNIPKAESGGEMDMSQVNDFCMTQLIELANELQPLKYFVTQRFSSKEDKKEYVGKLILLFKEPVDKSVVNTISNFIEKAEDCHRLFEQSINFSDSEPKAITINILDENFADREFGRGGKVYDNSPKKINLDKTKKITTVLGDYNLGLITDDFVYYFNSSESDENAQTIMYNKKGELISDNYFATQDLLEILENNQDFEYIHPDLENYKKEIN